METTDEYPTLDELLNSKPNPRTAMQCIRMLREFAGNNPTVTPIISAALGAVSAITYKWAERELAREKIVSEPVS